MEISSGTSDVGPTVQENKLVAENNSLFNNHNLGKNVQAEQDHKTKQVKKMT